ncbi:hypothetical protein ELI30_10160 [Rhizobium leguminosarum]|nr:hypothetical protein ELI32_10615 [Rhizobium leguminosarum]TAV58143.1 hypothetical protein ELI31_10145 [Rhizobium leguminosarum]TAV69086.1 hypothetical protein ELI30_10160 [Rhizobium leguminosarum]TAY66775.1 hypothetical protein ELH82_11530 [Rhizobium leguminosarum]
MSMRYPSIPVKRGQAGRLVIGRLMLPGRPRSDAARGVGSRCSLIAQLMEKALRRAYVEARDALTFVAGVLRQSLVSAR